MLTRILALLAVLLLAPSTLAHANARALSLESASLGIFARNVDILKEIPDLTHCCIKEKSTEQSESSNRREEYLRARYMDPSQGRFLGMDRFEGVGMDPPSLHKYLYNQNGPTNRIDPSGSVSLVQVGVVLNAIGVTINVATYAVYVYTGNVAGLAQNIAEDAASLLIPGGALTNSARRIAGLFLKGKRAFKWGLAHSSDVLRHNMEIFANLPKACARCQAHHIIPGGEMYDEAIYAREILRRNGVDINSFANGAWLDEASHYGRHFKNYTLYVYRKIAAAESSGGKEGVLTGLKELREELMSGQLDHLL